MENRITMIEEENIMGNLMFKYGTMGAAKTAEALICKYRYEETGNKVLLLKTKEASRDGKHIVSSRIKGLTSESGILEEFLSMDCTDMMVEASKYNLIIVDEIQFATKEAIDVLSDIVDSIGTNICCYGLKTDHKGELFEGSKRLLEIADSIREIEIICKCGKKAILNKKISNDNDKTAKYISVCRKCYKEL